MNVLLDFHGCLTDGKINMSHDGKTLFESMHVRDTRAIRELIARGYHVYIVTASDSPIIDSYCQKVGCEKITLRDKSEAYALRPYIAMGDDTVDLPMLEGAEIAFCPADADSAVLRHPNIIPLITTGGRGTVAEMITLLMKPKTSSVDELIRYSNGLKNEIIVVEDFPSKK